MPRLARGLAFQCSSGRVVQVKEAVCWRHVEGRTCFSAEMEKEYLPELEHAFEESTPDATSTRQKAVTEVVVIPIAPTVVEMKGRDGEAVERGGVSEAQPNSADAVATKRYGWIIMAAAERARAALVAAGLAVKLDVNAKQRPSVKFDHWERCGVRVRLEIGLREAESDKVCVWVESNYMDRAMQAISASAPAAPTHTSSRLQQLTLQQAVAACSAVVLHDRAAPAKSHLFAAQDSAGAWAIASIEARVEHVRGASRKAQIFVLPDPRCRRLHLQLPLPTPPGEVEGGDGGGDNPEYLCVNHLKFLAGVGRACYCASGHISDDTFKALLAAAHKSESHHPLSSWLPAPAPSLAAHEETSDKWQDMDEDSSPSPHHKQGAEGLMLVIGNVPASCGGASVAAALDAAFAPFGLLSPPRISRGSIQHGYARLYLPSLSLARKACEELAGKLIVDGQVLSVSLSAGRADTLFPKFDYGLRKSLRLDPVASFSVVDQVLADQLTELIGAVAICLLPPGPSSPSLSTSSAAACGQGLLPLSVTDATACSGGMSLSLMRRFRMVQAVEVDDDRIQDLRHNIQAVLDHHPALEQQSVSANASTSGATKASCAVCASHSESCAAAATAEAGEGAKSRGWECGQVFSYHADYTQLSCSLQQDLVVIDPPWGGTGYRDRRACESGSRGESDMQFGRLQLSQVASHLLYFHAPLLMLRLPSTFDCKEFTAALSECRHVCPLSHAHTHQRCPEPGAGAVKVYDMEVRYGRTKVLLLARLPIDASLHDSTIRALRQALAQLALTSYGAQQDIDREMEIVSKGLDACHLPHTAQQTTPRPVEPHYKPHPPQQTTNDKEPSSSSSSSRRKLLYRLGRMPRLIAAPEYLSSAGRSKIDESLQGLKLAV